MQIAKEREIGRARDVAEERERLVDRRGRRRVPVVELKPRALFPINRKPDTSVERRDGKTRVLGELAVELDAPARLVGEIGLVKARERLAGTRRAVKKRLNAQNDRPVRLVKFKQARAFRPPGERREFCRRAVVGVPVEIQYEVANKLKNNSFSLGYMFSHSSNGMRTKNPGHNAFGFSIGFNHNF
ncbi:MAG: acyloxyacyl hydrolase [Thermoguttaceae bacterium]|nr:acyloxyacyl hydrolase [Thermoguttaceae bacterium]